MFKFLNRWLHPRSQNLAQSTQRFDAAYLRFMSEVKSLEVVCKDLQADIQPKKKALPYDHH